MTPKDLTIFQSAPALMGQWFNIENFSALSVHLINLEAASDTWIEVSNNPLCDPLYNPSVLSPPSGSWTIDGVPITGNLAGHASYSPPVTGDSGDEQDISFSSDGSQAMWSPSCLIWSYIRVNKTGGASADETTAFLFGQVST